MRLFLIRVLQEFAGDGEAGNAADGGYHEIMTPVAEITDELRGEGAIQKLDHLFAVAAVRSRDGAIFDAGPRLAPDFLEVEVEWAPSFSSFHGACSLAR